MVQKCNKSWYIDKYAIFAERYPDADQLIRALCVEVGRISGECATLNPAIGYVLRQKGLKTIIITAEIACSSAAWIQPWVELMDAGDHYWNLVSDSRSFWHLDASNPFQIWKWYNQNLPMDQWPRVAYGKEPGPHVPIETLDFIWGRPSAHGIVITPDTLSMEAPFFDGLEYVGKKNRVRELFRAHGFHDPYEFRAGILDIDIAEAHIPL